MSLAIVEEAALSDVGRQRKTNEDSFYGSSPVFAVADGMGGARAGEVASATAVGVFEEGRDPRASPEHELVRIAQEANRRIYAMAREDESRAGMGTTLTAVIAGDNDVSIGHVGDSRAYRLRHEVLERLTTDHSLVEEYIRRGELTREGAESHPQRSIITRALGPEPEVDVDTFTFPAVDGDVYLLCSDGLTGMVSEERMGEILRAHDRLDEAATELVGLANANGGRDNITVVLFRVGEQGDVGSEEDTGEIDAAAVAAAAGVGSAPEEDARDTDTAARPASASASAGTATQGAATATERPTAAHAGGAETFLLDAETAERERRAAGVPTGSGTAEDREEAAPVLAPRRRRRRRSVLGVLARVVLTLAVLGALAYGAYEGANRIYFLGTSDRGLITLYRGLPYDGPGEVTLYAVEYESAVPAATLPRPQRQRVLDHELRSRSDAVDLVRELETRRGLSAGG